MQVEAEIVDRHLSLIVKNHREEIEGAVGRKLDEPRMRAAAFTLLCLNHLRGFSTEEALPHLTEGGNDLGIDAIWIDEPVRLSFRVTLLQCKYHRELDGNRNFPLSGLEKALQSARMLLVSKVPLKGNPRLQRFFDEINRQRGDGLFPMIRLVMCSNGLAWKQPEAQQSIDAAALGAFVTLEHLDHLALFRGLTEPPPIHDALAFCGSVGRSDFDGGSLLNGAVKGSELARLVVAHGGPLLDHNVRQFLGPERNPVNQEIARSLQTAEGRRRFLVRNLGVTFVCDALELPPGLIDSPRVRVRGLLLLNGAQTVSVLAHLRANQPSWPAGGEDDPVVPVRLIEIGRSGMKDQLRREITHSNNHQTPVDLKDLHSDDELQRRLEYSIAQLGFVYHRQRNDVIPRASAFGPAVVAEAILAIWRGRPQRARQQVADHYNQVYEIVFTEELTGAQAVVAVLLWRSAERLAGAVKSKRAGLAQNGWPFAAMLMGQALLEELSLELGALDHRQFERAHAWVRRNGRRSFEGALATLAKAVRAQRRAALDSLALFEIFDRGSVLRFLPRPATSARKRRGAGKPAPEKKRSAARDAQGRKALAKKAPVQEQRARKQPPR